MKKAIKKLAALAAVSAAIAAPGLALVGCTDTRIIAGGDAKMEVYENADKYSVGDFTYKAADVTSVEIDWVLGKVTLVSSDADTLKGDEANDGLEDKYKVHYLVENGVLHVKFWESGLSDKAKSAEKALTLEVPAALAAVEAKNISGKLVADKLTAASVKLTTTSGDIEVGEVTASGAFKATSTSGKVEVGTLSVTSAEMTTVSGGININTLTAIGKCTASSVSGDIALGSVTASVLEGSSTSGDIGITIVACASMELSDNTGDVTLAFQNTLLGAVIKFETATGHYTSDTAKGSSGTYTVGSGIGSVKVKTTTGDLIIKTATAE